MLEFGWVLQRKTLILKGAVVALIAVAALVVFLTGGHGAKGVTVPETGGSGQAGQESAGTGGNEGELIVIDVAGAVRNPDVVELPAGSRVEDAVDAAGGLLVNADVSSINRAAVLSDGEKVYIPFLDEGDGTSGDSGDDGLVNLNTADAALLETLPGIGPATAAKIIQYRNDNGLFKKTEDLMNVSGIGPVTYAELEPLIGI
jgi:competence protein ComEA